MKFLHDVGWAKKQGLDSRNRQIILRRASGHSKDFFCLVLGCIMAGSAREMDTDLLVLRSMETSLTLESQRSKGRVCPRLSNQHVDRGSCISKCTRRRGSQTLWYKWTAGLSCHHRNFPKGSQHGDVHLKTCMRGKLSAPTS